MERDELKRHMEVVYNRCCAILKDPDQAWDALQDVFESFYEASKKREIRQPLFYLYRSSTNHCFNMLRRQKKLLPLLTEHLEGDLGGHHTAENRLMIDALVQQFGEDTIQLFIYRHVDQMTYDEIADLVGLSDRGVKKKLARLDEKIRQQFPT